MENTYEIIIRRAFLIGGLPEPWSPADSHLQVFDNYLERTRIRLRKIRMPETKEWTRVLEQIYSVEEDSFAKLKMSRMFLNETEYKVLEAFKGRETRKNRYFYELEGKRFEIDIFLGKLWGLNIAKVFFETEDEMEKFDVPEFAVLEITNDEFFIGDNLVEKTFEDVQERLNIG